MARVALCVALFIGANTAQAESSCGQHDLGCEIVNGQHAVAAHLRDDDLRLPPSTTRCINCHTQQQSGAAFAPPLTAENLLDAKRRRGGPPSRYDLSSFCRAVKDGIDPANVLLRKAMPQFQISDSECAALWQFVTKG